MLQSLAGSAWRNSAGRCIRAPECLRDAWSPSAAVWQPEAPQNSGSPSRSPSASPDRSTSHEKTTSSVGAGGDRGVQCLGCRGCAAPGPGFEWPQQTHDAGVGPAADLLLANAVLGLRRQPVLLPHLLRRDHARNDVVCRLRLSPVSSRAGRRSIRVAPEDNLRQGKA